jgi:hypothetical protein
MRRSPNPLHGREDEFRTLWGNPSLTSGQIAAELATSRSHVFNLASSLGLPSRNSLREAHGLEIIPGGREYADQQARLQLERCAEIEAREPRWVGFDRSVCFVCHGPCPPHLDGHDQCRGRRAA